MIAELFYSHIGREVLFIQKVSVSVFRYRWTKKALRTRKVSGAFEKRAPAWDDQERVVSALKNQKTVAANACFCLLIKELISANGEKHRLYEENNNLDLRLKELSAEYTNRLQQYIHDIAVRLAAYYYQ